MHSSGTTRSQLVGIVLVELPGMISPNYYMHNYVSTIHTHAKLYDPNNHNGLTLIGGAVMIERKLQTLSFTQASGPEGHIMWTVMKHGSTSILLFFNDQLFACETSITIFKEGYELA